MASEDRIMTALRDVLKASTSGVMKAALMETKGEMAKALRKSLDSQDPKLVSSKEKAELVEFYQSMVDEELSELKEEYEKEKGPNEK